MYAFSFAISKLSLGELQKLQQGAATITPWVNCSDLNYTFKDSESIQALGVGYELSCKIHLLLLNKNISVYLSVQEQMNNFCLKFRKHILVFRQKSGREKKNSPWRKKSERFILQTRNLDGNIHASLNVKIFVPLFVISVDVFR